MSFGQRFKELRLEKNYTQQGLADEFNKLHGCSFSKSTISQYENDKRIPETGMLINFAIFFNVSTDYLLALSDERNLDKLDKEADLVSEFFAVGNELFDSLSVSEKHKLFEKLSKMYFDSL